ncbi:30S ribosomal protein S6 [bacterium]|nr:30S ribosomal protein S6 [bacterium]
MIRRYETIFVVDATLDDSKIESIIDKVVKYLNDSKANIVETDKWGKKRLAYTIQKRQYGYYTSIIFEGEGSCLLELERVYRLDELILRYLTLVETPIMKKARLVKANKPKTEETKEVEA